MKKILSFLIAILMVLGMSGFLVSAENLPNKNKTYLDKDKSIASIGWDPIWEMRWNFNRFILKYDFSESIEKDYEEYGYAVDPETTLNSWMLIYATTIFDSTGDEKPYAASDKWVIRQEQTNSPLFVHYCIYYCETMEFYDIADLWDGLSDDSWDGKKHNENLYKKLKFYKIGELIGDMDKDYKLTVKDATYIQKCLAGILEFPQNDKVDGDYTAGDHKYYLAYVSDFNRDGERSIKDATAIQKFVAGIADY